MKLFGFSFVYFPERVFSRRLYSEKEAAIYDMAKFILSDYFLYRDNVISDFGELTVEELVNRVLSDESFASDFSYYAEIEEFEFRN